jgi:hypothetical protein
MDTTGTDGSERAECSFARGAEAMAASRETPAFILSDSDLRACRDGRNHAEAGLPLRMKAEVVGRL